MKKILKDIKGVTMTDIAAAILILMLFVGVIGRLYYSIAYNNSLIRLNAIATYYVVIVAEDVDRSSYEDVKNMSDSELKNYLNDKYQDKFDVWPDNLKITLTVNNYNEDDANKEDIIKKVKIEAKYNVLNNEEQNYTINSIKVKER